MATAPFRLMPDFLIIGGNRCGTAALYEYLCGHPCFAPSLPSRSAFLRAALCQRRELVSKAFSVGCLQILRHKIRRKSFVTGEATTYYIFHPHAPRRILATVPKMKLIALLRNPVDRAYAQYHQKIRRGYEPLSFEDAIDAEPERLRGEKEKMLANETYNSFQLPSLFLSHAGASMWINSRTG